jgi:hypothetical protein
MSVQVGNDLITIEFHGSTIERNDSESRKTKSYNSGRDEDLEVSYSAELNKKADPIARGIEREIRRSLPNGIKVSVIISFKEGSLLWDGIATIANFAATTSGTIGFVEYLNKIVTYAVSKLVTKDLPSIYKQSEINTSVIMSPNDRDTDHGLSNTKNTPLINASNHQAPSAQNNTIVGQLNLALLTGLAILTFANLALLIGLMLMAAKP